MSDQPQPTSKPVVGITLGDYNGIGPEVILKALYGNQLTRHCTPIVYGSMRVLNRYRNLLELKDWQLQGIQQVGQASPKLTNVITCFPDNQTEVEPGKITPEAGQAALACLQRATDDLKAGLLDALVTAPINKHNIQSETFKFPGHTEYFASVFEVRDSLMFMVSETLRVGVVTGHVPLGRVRAGVNQDSLTRKISQMLDSLKRDFGIVKPKIAVLGLNPHAGEAGLLGQEEKEILGPVMENFKKKGHLLFGPFPTDGFFAAGHYRKFDAVLAMYHDQGLTPFKMIAFDSGVNFTAGLPVVRTSPDHGTAYDIAGKNEADEHSMLAAIFTAIDIAKNRAENPLPKPAQPPAPPSEAKAPQPEGKKSAQEPRPKEPREPQPVQVQSEPNGQPSHEPPTDTPNPQGREAFQVYENQPVDPPAPVAEAPAPVLTEIEPAAAPEVQPEEPAAEAPRDTPLREGEGSPA
jgi:4-hydroxythreonine-4-phosphate dehydrogenase